MSFFKYEDLEAGEINLFLGNANLELVFYWFTAYFQIIHMQIVIDCEFYTPFLI